MSKSTSAESYRFLVPILHSLPGRAFAPEVNIEAGTFPTSGTAIDLNLDGFPDLVFGNSGASTFTHLLNIPGPVVAHTLVASPEPSLISQPFTLTAFFTTPAGATETQLTGEATFFIDWISIGSAALQNDRASLAAPASLAAGVHRLTASWSGDSAHPCHPRQPHCQ